jgi:hypothetical protein
MPRPTNFVSMVRNLVREEVQQAIHWLLGSAGPKKKAKNGRRRRGRRRGPGRPPGSKTRMRRGPGRPPRSKNKKRRGPGRPPKKAKAE